MKLSGVVGINPVGLWGDGGLIASGRAYQLRVPRSSPGTCWPLFYGNTAEWPKITHMLT